MIGDKTLMERWLNQYISTTRFQINNDMEIIMFFSSSDSFLWATFAAVAGSYTIIILFHLLTDNMV